MKILYCENREALLNGKAVKCLVEGANTLALFKLDNGIIKKCVGINNTRGYSGVNPYITSSDMLNLTEKETKGVMNTGKLAVYRSSGALNAKGEVMTREEQIKEGVARCIVITAHIINGKAPGNPTSYQYDIISDTGCSYRLEGEYTF